MFRLSLRTLEAVSPSIQGIWALGIDTYPVQTKFAAISHMGYCLSSWGHF